jgi:hypothetical protein
MFSSSGHTFESIGVVGCELGSSLLLYWQNFAKKRSEMKKISFKKIKLKLLIARSDKK